MVLLLSGCSYNPVIDPNTSAHPENFQADLAECRQIAEQAPKGAALTGAGVDAALGAGVAVATGHPGAAGQAAGGRAVIGGARGGNASSREKRMIQP